MVAMYTYISESQSYAFVFVSRVMLRAGSDLCVLASDPDVCSVCLEKRVDQENKDKLTYHDASITMQPIAAGQDPRSYGRLVQYQFV